MKILHDPVHSIDLPLDRLAFAPDPLNLNQPIECDCPACTLKRTLAAMHGVDVSAVKIDWLKLKGQPVMPLFNVPTAAQMGTMMDPFGFEAPTPTEVAQHTPLASQPQISAFDHGGGRQRAERGEPIEFQEIEAAIPPWLLRFIDFTAEVFAWCMAKFTLLVLASPRLSVVRDDQDCEGK
jgi:hypothetical protein